MNKKVQKAWAFYDWGNSVYSLVISTAVFPIYYNGVTSTKDSTQVDFLGYTFENTALYSYSLSFSFLVVALVSPMLSGIADYTGKKKNFMQFFCYLGALGCAGLFFFKGDNLLFGLAMSSMASIGFWGSLVFYNSFLPEIAAPEQQDRLSARGFSLGYIGSSILLIFILVMVSIPEKFGFADAGQASRTSFLIVALWWAGFAQYTFKHLPNNVYKRTPGTKYIWQGYRELRNVAKELPGQLSLRRFLYSFFFFSVGIQTVIYLASLFGDQELQLDSSKLIGTILIIQFVAIGGAYLFAYLSKRMGNLQALKVGIVIWTLICLASYTLSKEDAMVEYKFYAIGAAVGLVLGGVQALSRSTYSKLLPSNTHSHASYFSFYDVTEKIAIVFGTVIYGYLIDVTGSMNMSVLALTILFAIGFILLLRVKKTEHVY